MDNSSNGELDPNRPWSAMALSWGLSNIGAFDAIKSYSVLKGIIWLEANAHGRIGVTTAEQFYIVGLRTKDIVNNGSVRRANICGLRPCWTRNPRQDNEDFCRACANTLRDKLRQSLEGRVSGRGLSRSSVLRRINPLKSPYVLSVIKSISVGASY